MKKVAISKARRINYFFHSNIENLGLRDRRRSRFAGVTEGWLCRKSRLKRDGVLEYWVWWKEICFYMDGTEEKIKQTIIRF
jgi:hypothetical protein